MARLTAEQAEAARHEVWSALRSVARPDSRFHWDFASFIADFPGSDVCADRVLDLDVARDAALMFVTPDNSTEALRHRLIESGRPFLMTTYGIRRGFLHLVPDGVPPADRRYAATLDGMDRYATPVTLAEIARLAPIELLVTGGSAVSTSGVRFGKGHGYFDLEWAMLSEVGAVAEQAQVVDVVHDCQVVDGDLVAAVHDVSVDWIVTPTRTLRVADSNRSVGKVHWSLLGDGELSTVPPILELRSLLEQER